MNVKEILQRIPPPILYHYTTQKGLLGILSSKEIWATHTQYLNDAREFHHALDILQQATKDQPLLRDELYRIIADVNVCVCSFSEDGDSLSQWRAYGGRASGFAIGFSGEYLRRTFEQLGWLVPVVYEDAEQRSLIQTLLGDVREEQQKAFEAGRPLGASGNLVQYLYRYAPILKDKSFREEREWRIVTKPVNCTGEQFSFRAGPSTLAPYFRLSLLESESLGIREIIIGPTPHPDLSLNSVERLLTKNGIATADFDAATGVKLHHSQVPYRNW